jgi:hypothetical protein
MPKIKQPSKVLRARGSYRATRRRREEAGEPFWPDQGVIAGGIRYWLRRSSQETGVTLKTIAEAAWLDYGRLRQFLAGASLTLDELDALAFVLGLEFENSWSSAVGQTVLFNRNDTHETELDENGNAVPFSRPAPWADPRAIRCGQCEEA